MQNGKTFLLVPACCHPAVVTVALSSFAVQESGKHLFEVLISLPAGLTSVAAELKYMLNLPERAYVYSHIPLRDDPVETILPGETALGMALQALAQTAVCGGASNVFIIEHDMVFYKPFAAEWCNLDGNYARFCLLDGPEWLVSGEGDGGLPDGLTAAPKPSTGHCVLSGAALEAVSLGKGLPGIRDKLTYGCLAEMMIDKACDIRSLEELDGVAGRIDGNSGYGVDWRASHRYDLLVERAMNLKKTLPEPLAAYNALMQNVPV